MSISSLVFLIQFYGTDSLAGLMAAGAMPVAACGYKFPYTDVTSFLGLAQVIEGYFRNLTVLT
jgi:hypothetical protein